MGHIGKWAMLGVLAAGVAGCGRRGAEATVDLNVINDVKQLEPYVGKHVTIIGVASLGKNGRRAALSGNGSGGGAGGGEVTS